MRTRTIHRWFTGLIGCALLTATMTSCNRQGDRQAAGAAPSEEEIKQAIERQFTETYLQNSGNAVADKVSLGFGPIQVGSATQKAPEFGALKTVYPVKVTVTITVTYSNNPTVRTVTRGNRSDDVFLFYKDEFNAWTFKTGSL
jgi:hypothetical protein